MIIYLYSFKAPWCWVFYCCCGKLKLSQHILPSISAKDSIYFLPSKWLLYVIESHDRKQAFAASTQGFYLLMWLQELDVGGWFGWCWCGRFHFSLFASCHSWYLNTFSNNKKCAIPITSVILMYSVTALWIFGSMLCTLYISHKNTHFFLPPQNYKYYLFWSS